MRLASVRTYARRGKVNARRSVFTVTQARRDYVCSVNKTYKHENRLPDRSRVVASRGYAAFIPTGVSSIFRSDNDGYFTCREAAKMSCVSVYTGIILVVHYGEIEFLRDVRAVRGRAFFGKLLFRPAVLREVNVTARAILNFYRKQRTRP